jgi:hypothetical protein
VSSLRRLSRWLVANLGATELETTDFAHLQDHNFTHGWRFSLPINGESLALDFLIDERFPRSRPRIGLAAPPLFPSYPHVEDDGLVCILSPVDELDPTKPVGIAKHVLAGAANILEQGLGHTNDNDFRAEFVSYWNPTAKGIEVRSLVDPCGPTRRISVWRGKHFYVVANSKKDLLSWVDNAFGKPAAKIESGLLIWLTEPMLPAEYPCTPKDVRALVEHAGIDAVRMFDQLLGQTESESLILFGAESGNGPCFASVSLTLVRRGYLGRQPALGGFRKSRSPAQMLVDCKLQGKVSRAAVERIDPFWIHGRDSNPDLLDLRGVTVGMIGCGSLGSPVARILAQAGVGRILFIDRDKMNWANVGRHGLGAAAVNGRKSSMLAERLARDFPHSSFTAHQKTWQQVDREQPGILEKCDLLVSTIGSWSEEGELNEWHLSHERKPTIVYGWTEPHGCAGHAVIINDRGGCLACGLTCHGEPLIRVVDWPDSTLRREPACGAYFQPYGPSEITMCAALVADMALDALLGRVTGGNHRILAARAGVVEAVGGTWSKQWLEMTGGRIVGGNIEAIDWPRNLRCPVCE